MSSNRDPHDRPGAREPRDRRRRKIPHFPLLPRAGSAGLASAGALAVLILAGAIMGCDLAGANLNDGRYVAVTEVDSDDGWAVYALLEVRDGRIHSAEVDRINEFGDRESEQAVIEAAYRDAGDTTPAAASEQARDALEPDGTLNSDRLSEVGRHADRFEAVLEAALDAARDGDEEPAVVAADGSREIDPEELSALITATGPERARAARRGGNADRDDQQGGQDGGDHRAAAVSSHYLATAAAETVLQDGGTAADAAFAMAAVLTVTEPWFSSILGGGTWALYYDAEADEMRALDGVAGAASAATAEFFGDTDRYQEFGMHMANVPGAWAGWMEWLKEYGEIGLDELMAPAIAAAEDGVPASESLESWLSQSVEDFRNWPDTAAIYLRNGQPARAGDMIYQPDAANTFRELVDAYQAERERGERAALEAAKDQFYRGPIAERIVSFSDEHGGLFELSDFTEFDDAGFREPLSIEYQDLTVYQNPPNSQGITQLIALNILQDLDLAGYEAGSAEAVHLQVEAIKLAMADRNRHVADPDAVEVPVEQLLSDRHAEMQRGRISMESALKWPFEDVLVDGDDHYTTTFHVVDRYGNAAAVTTSLGAQFLVVGDTGIHINDRMRFMHYDPDDPNVTEPGKKVRHTSNPYMVLRDGRPYLLGGNTGADFQAQGQVQQFVAVVEHGMSPAEAVEQPRFESTGFPATTYPFTAENGLGLEDGVSAETREELQRRGHELVDGGVFGSANMIRILDPERGEIEYGAEPREDASRGVTLPE